MDANQTAQLKKTLLEERTKIETELQRIATKNPNIKGDWTAFPPDKADPSDTMDERAQNVTDFEERRAVEQSFELRLKAIDETLQKLDAGTYGICSNCRSPIDKKRLEAMLIVKHCFDCANKTTIA